MSPEPTLIIVGGRLGRPPRAGVRSERTIKLLVTESEFKAIKGVAAAQQQPVATIIRDAVNEFVADFGERSIFRK